MDYFEWFSKRIGQLRIEKGVSARDMSLSLGQSESYINKIENRRTMPSMAGFFYICEYFGITPEEFFSQNINSPIKSNKLNEELCRLTPKQSEHLLEVIKDLNKLNEK